MMGPYGRDMYHPMMYPMPFPQQMMGQMPGMPGMPPMAPMGPMAPMPPMGPMPQAGIPPQPQQQMPRLPTDKEALGEILFPMVENANPEFASKITGMLLEMEVDVIHSIILYPSHLNKWMAEALKVLSSATLLGSPESQLRGAKCDLIALPRAFITHDHHHPRL